MSEVIGYPTGNSLCPYESETAIACNTLVNEVAKSTTWADMMDAIHAIQRVRSRSASAIAEWEHLNNPSPMGCGGCKK